MATAMGEPPKNKHEDMLKQSDPDGKFRRQDAQFRGFISKDPNSEFPAEKDRYVLYINFGCPWAHRTNIVRSLKGLEDIIQVAIMGFVLTQEGWIFDGKDGSMEKDPLYGFTRIRDLYHKADPNYNLRFTVPMLWDKKKETVVSNESSEIIRMMFSEFDDLLPKERREESHPLGGYVPDSLKSELDTLNEWVYHDVNNGVYKTGFASTQEAYEDALMPLFRGLDKLEDHLSQPGHWPYLFGEHITEADIRLFPTLMRFDTSYHTVFKCNLKMLRYDYPRLHHWLRLLYWDLGPKTNGGAFHNTSHVSCWKRGYAIARKMPVCPKGPLPDVLPLDDVKHQKDIAESDTPGVAAYF